MNRFFVRAVIQAILGSIAAALRDEYKLLMTDVRDDIKSLKHELERMQGFLLSEEDSEQASRAGKYFANKARVLSYDAQDKIDNAMLLVVDHTYPHNGIKKHISKFKNLLPGKIQHHQIARDIKDIKMQIEEMWNIRETYFIEGECSRRVSIDPRTWMFHKHGTTLVGIADPIYEIVKWLRNKEAESAQHQKVISIVGCAGLGKTTLARQVYDKLAANFECQAFVSVSPRPDVTKILRSILSQLHIRDTSCSEISHPELIVDQIREFLQDKSYLMVIDDIWDIPTWQDLKSALCDNNCGSVIMTTTRMYDIAKSCCSSHGDLVYKIRPLTVAESESLLCNQVFGCQGEIPPNLEEFSKAVLEKCGGLPLAIIAISSLLATGRETKEEWDFVKLPIDFAQGGNSDIDAMRYILSLSYFDLPHHLRNCLLYLTMFPANCLIERERLVHRWISEGLIHSEDGEDLFEIGERYLYEFVHRSLIESVGMQYDGKARFYRVHSVILDFLISRSTEENFCTLISNNSRPAGILHRLSLLGNEDPVSVAQLDLSHARSLGVFGHFEKLPSLVKSNALRVLDLQDCSSLGNDHVKDIGKPFKLRYLNISGTDITELPIQNGDLKYLETLDASFTELVEIPGSITRLKQLVRLFVSDETKLPDEIGRMKSLQELGDINAFKQSVNFMNELGKLTGLRKLGIIWDTNDILKFGNGSYKEKKLASSLSKLDAGELRTLRITFYLREKDGSIGDPFLPALNSIREVYLRRGRMYWIKKWLLSLANIEKLYISGGDEIEQDDLHTVGCLPTLVEFKLYSGCLGPIIISSGFQQLERLELKFSFSQLVFELGAMPNLKKLDLHIYLSKFKSSGAGFDFGIQHLSSLAWVSIVIFCEGVSAKYVEAAEGAFKSMAGAHPNLPTLEMIRESSDFVSHDE